MEQITIDFKNAFDCSKKEKSKGCRSGYVRLVRFMDDKKHTRPQVCDGGRLGEISSADGVEWHATSAQLN